MKLEIDIEPSEIPDAVIEEILAEVLEYFKSVTWFSLPGVWGDCDGSSGPPPDDPLEVRMIIDDETGRGKERARFGFTEELRDFIGYCRDDGSFSHGLTRISVAMRSLADEIDSAVKLHADAPTSPAAPPATPETPARPAG